MGDVGLCSIRQSIKKIETFISGSRWSIERNWKLGSSVFGRLPRACWHLLSTYPLVGGHRIIQVVEVSNCNGRITHKVHLPAARWWEGVHYSDSNKNLNCSWAPFVIKFSHTHTLSLSRPDLYTWTRISPLNVNRALVEPGRHKNLQCYGYVDP